MAARDRLLMVVGIGRKVLKILFATSTEFVAPPWGATFDFRGKGPLHQEPSWGRRNPDGRLRIDLHLACASRPVDHSRVTNGFRALQ